MKENDAETEAERNRQPKRWQGAPLQMNNVAAIGRRRTQYNTSNFNSLLHLFATLFLLAILSTHSRSRFHGKEDDADDDDTENILLEK